jgi:hypothetical protein
VFGKDLNILEEASLTVRPTTQYRAWSIPVVQPTTVVLFNQAKPTLIWNRPEATRQSVGQNSGHHYRPYRTSPTTHSLTPPLVFVPPPTCAATPSLYSSARAGQGTTLLFLLCLSSSSACSHVQSCHQEPLL